ncbi:glyoxalase/bleomycin resistance/dioxygenase family protein [Alkalihalophilus marmarensis]|jgi:catechol 2,3-dioxygenase-like lactoylglutathione lyase family enzyme|uniref:Glyoxalase n=1 Tax=Alkalihalophilus marmarensis DSM 21297 TaxID=1188261 RepID=U6SS67_9BACI|nr:VOC family protein [Alkalihalophilus marmarensis]ERN53760.1 glyoxalase [Alkalihalophilus marmarensis DSM 21297]MCM3490628.1 glyoxalase/bleomycin resistance/dioxygenase family protein [Alkalihalophilus marmarensis]
MWKKLECIAIYTEDIKESVTFYQSLGLTKAWEAYQDEEEQWMLVGMRFPDGESELVLKNNPSLNFAETEIVCDNVMHTYESIKSNPEVKWIRTPFPNSLGGHVAVMQAPDGNVFVLVGG